MYYQNFKIFYLLLEYILEKVHTKAQILLYNVCIFIIGILTQIPEDNIKNSTMKYSIFVDYLI